MGIRQGIRATLRRFGYDVVRWPTLPEPLARRRRLIESCAIDRVLDVGANTGQYAEELRTALGYSRPIVSFEPMRAAFHALEAKARADPCWQAFNVALGAENGTRTINVAANSWSSSLLPMLPAHASAAPESRYVGAEEIAIRTLDSLFDRLCRPGERVLLKIDTQGFEHEVLAGADQSLARIDAVQIEMSLVPLYAGQALFPDLKTLLERRGFALLAVEPGFADPRSGELLQVDGIFHRRRPGNDVNTATAPATERIA